LKYSDILNNHYLTPLLSTELYSHTTLKLKLQSVKLKGVLGMVLQIYTFEIWSYSGVAVWTYGFWVCHSERSEESGNGRIYRERGISTIRELSHANIRNKMPKSKYFINKLSTFYIVYVLLPNLTT